MKEGGLKILLVGKGAREHSLAWKLTQSPLVRHIYVVPGNGGTGELHNVSNLRSVQANDYPGLVLLAKDLGIGLVVAGPDDAVVDGIEGFFRNTGIPCFAPTKEAAEIEGSKSFAKDFMRKYKIPTASYQPFGNYQDGKRYLKAVDATRVVIKVDGLAAGKGVVLPRSQTEAFDTLREIMVDAKFYLEGDEFSILTFCDGKTFKSFPAGQDHKRIFDGNQGPNTGGMGVYAPQSFVTPDRLREIEHAIIQPTLDGLQAEGALSTLSFRRPFTGLLFTGFMMTAEGPRVLEYNARFGDPETQTMMMLSAPECDLAAVLLACCAQRLDSVPIPVLRGFGCNVVVASSGYPESYRKRDIITLAPCPDDVHIFHAGTDRNSNGELTTAGGRVFSVARASSLAEMVEKGLCLPDVVFQHSPLPAKPKHHGKAASSTTQQKQRAM
ncbi:putative bifunctional purine Ade1 [Parathielavia hyrcaniae]|uniref:phosphoribosylamine--glycine ligase n=1 Tax=Parathielavia hyrcaniae TaxID=113614 RepID=A0AAN6Q7V2_9PEZI|nr:putative bifunctional purine Ade1 [Parathielavia hyrcaniae]